MKRNNFYQLVVLAFIAFTGITAAFGQVSSNASPTATYPMITNQYTREYNGDSIIHVTANGIPAIVAMPGQQLRTLLPALGITRADFVKFNDLPNVVTDQMVAGAVYYLKPKANRSSAEFHVVQHKENLWDVSQRYGIRKNHLLSRNRLSGDAVTAGTRLVLNKRIGRRDRLEVVPLAPMGPDTPGPWDRLLQEFAPRPATTAPVTTATNPSVGQQAVIPNAKYHTVQPNESLFTVSQQYNVNILDLKKWNNLQSGTVNPGDRLIVNGHELPGIGAPIATTPASEPIILPAGTSPATTLPTTAMDTPATTSQPAATGLPIENFFDKPAVEEPATSAPVAMAESEIIHVVKPSEGVWSIARMYNVDPKDVMAWNGFDNNTQLKTNQQVIIRKSVPATATATASVPAADFNTAAATLPRTGMNALDPPGINSFAPGTATASTAAAQPATSTTAPAVESEMAGVYHTVAANENIFMLANQYAARVEDIRRWNNLQVGTPLNPGQRLKVGEKAMEVARPVTTATGAARPATAPVVTSANAKTHIVERGETLYAISRKYGTTVEAIKTLNNMPDEKINAGQSLIVGTNDRATAPQQPASQPQGSAKPAAKPAPKSNTGTTGSVVLSGGIAVNNNLPPDQLGTSFGVSQAVSGEQSAYYQLAAPNTKIIGAPPAATSTAKPSNKRQNTADVHVVQAGETIYSISRKYKVSVEQLIRLNNKASEQIVVGEKLRVK